MRLMMISYVSLYLTWYMCMHSGENYKKIMLFDIFQIQTFKTFSLIFILEVSGSNPIRGYFSLFAMILKNVNFVRYVNFEIMWILKEMWIFEKMWILGKNVNVKFEKYVIPGKCEF